MKACGQMPEETGLIRFCVTPQRLRSASKPQL
jgi:hypothetical protein